MGQIRFYIVAIGLDLGMVITTINNKNDNSNINCHINNKEKMTRQRKEKRGEVNLMGYLECLTFTRGPAPLGTGKGHKRKNYCLSLTGHPHPRKVGTSRTSHVYLCFLRTYACCIGSKVAKIGFKAII